MDGPYKGLAPYTEADAEYFFGRDTERRIISANLRASRLTLIYGESGVGKSSLLSAGVAQDLKGDPDYRVVLCQVWRADPGATLTAAIADAEPGIDKTFQYGPLPVDPLETLSVWSERVRRENYRTLLVILDQFEEYFQYHPRDGGPGSLFEALPQLVGSTAIPVNFLISIREDSIAWLDRFKGSIPKLFDNYCRVDYLTRVAAKDAMLRPLQKFSAAHPQHAISIEDLLAESVLDEMLEAQRRDEMDETPLRVQPPYLQLVMSRWWEEERKARSYTMRRKTLDNMGGVKSIVDSHLKMTINPLPVQEQDALARLFELLVTSTGRKQVRTTEELLEEAQIEASLLNDLLEKLRQARLVTPVPPPKGVGPGKESYEFAHDVVAKVAANWLKEYRLETAEREAGEAKRRAQELDHLRLEAERQRSYAEKKERESTARERIAYSLGSLGDDPECSLLLAIHAVNGTWACDQTVLPAAEDAVHRVLLQSRIRLTLAGHEDTVASVAWSPDGKRLATGSRDHTAKVWEAATGRELLTLSGHKDRVSSVAWSPDGKRLATGSADHTAKIWDAATGLEQFTLSGHKGRVTSVAWSPDGDCLATGSEDHTAKVWLAALNLLKLPVSVERGRDLTTISGHKDRVSSVAWSPDGKRLATGSDDHTARVWEAATWRELLTLGLAKARLGLTVSNIEMSIRAVATVSGHKGGVSCVAWSPDGKRLATGSDDRTAKVWDTQTGQEHLMLPGHKARVTCVAWSRDGMRVATASGDHTAKVWDASDGSELLTLSGRKNNVSSVAWSPDGQRLATGSGDHTAKVWESGALALSGHRTSISSVAWSPDGKRLATASDDKTTKVWPAPEPNRLGARRELLTLSGHGDKVSSVAWSPDGKRLATASADHSAKLWDAAVRGVPFTLSGHEGAVLSVAWSPDGTMLATGSADKNVKVWQAAGRPLLTLSGHKGTVSSVAWRPDGRRLATGSEDRTTKVWETATWQELLTLSGHTGKVSCVAWGADGRWLATGSWDGTVKVWEAETGRPLLRLSGHQRAVLSVAWSPDGKRLATGSSDKTAKVWQAASGLELLSLSSHQGDVRGVAWSPDGKWLATAGAEGIVLTHAMDIVLLMSLARSRVTRNLTLDECRRYLHSDTVPPIPFGELGQAVIEADNDKNEV